MEVFIIKKILLFIFLLSFFTPIIFSCTKENKPSDSEQTDLNNLTEGMIFIKPEDMKLTQKFGFIDTSGTKQNVKLDIISDYPSYQKGFSLSLSNVQNKDLSKISIYGAVPIFEGITEQTRVTQCFLTENETLIYSKSGGSCYNGYATGSGYINLGNYNEKDIIGKVVKQLFYMTSLNIYTLGPTIHIIN